MKPPHRTTAAQAREKQKTQGFSLDCKALSAVVLSGLLLLLGQPAIANAVAPASFAALGESTQRELVQQALKHDAQGNPQQAHLLFDAHLGNRIEAEAPAPSAADFVNLGAYPKGREFAAQDTPHHTPDAHLCLRRLTAHGWQEQPAGLRAPPLSAASIEHSQLELANTALPTVSR